MKKSLFLLIICCSCLNINAQDDKDDFQAYRQKMLSGFQGFRKNILDDYAKFLNGIWEDYEMFKGKKAHPLPKPHVQPQKKKDEPKPDPKTIVPENVNPTEPLVENNTPAPKPVPVTPSTHVPFSWCGMPMQLTDAKLTENLNDFSKEGLIAYFEAVNNSRIRQDVLPQMANIANSYNFNDWCLFLLIESYVKRIKAGANANTRNFICWYMMAQFGFDVRLAFNANHLFYLLPFKQQVYACNFIKIHGTPYYIWGEGNIDENAGFSTPNVPDDTGEAINLIMTKPLNLPYHAKRFTHTFSGHTLSVDVNENLIRVMKQFPQMPIYSYAVSSGDNKARSQLLSQMEKFIEGMSELDAANFMLQFIQSFDYATDDDQFGYEKPFFIEETLYYPKCDCEDRAILYHFLVTQLLRKDVHLVHYPNHECTAVNFSQRLNADSYVYGGKQYVICDPTYIGASIGMCMPDYRNVKPEIYFIK